MTMPHVVTSSSSSPSTRGMSSVPSFGLRLRVLTVLFILVVLSPEGSEATLQIVYKNTTLSTINDLPARYMNERYSFYSLQGYVVKSWPDDTACDASKINPPPDLRGTTMMVGEDGEEEEVNWILLAKRSPDCRFEKKILNAQNKGYNAIIIHNVHSNQTEIMGVDDPSKLIIFATFVGEYDGLVLEQYRFQKCQTCYVKITSSFSINSYLLPFSIVVGICFLVMICFMVRLLYTQVKRYLRERRRNLRRKLPASSLRKIPVQKYSKNNMHLSETCAICLEDFTEGEKIRVLGCGHGFHTTNCIDPWLTKGRRVCPICKRRVVVDNDVGIRNRRLDSDNSDEDEDGEDDQQQQQQQQQQQNANDSRILTVGPAVVNDNDEEEEPLLNTRNSHANSFSSLIRRMFANRNRQQSESVAVSPPQESHSSGNSGSDSVHNSQMILPRQNQEASSSSIINHNVNTSTISPPSSSLIQICQVHTTTTATGRTNGAFVNNENVSVNSNNDFDSDDDDSSPIEV